MKIKNKVTRAAIQLNNWRVFPRIMLAFYIIASSIIIAWFLGLPDPTTAQVTFASTLIGIGGGFFSTYVLTGGVKDPDSGEASSATASDTDAED